MHKFDITSMQSVARNLVARGRERLVEIGRITSFAQTFSEGAKLAFASPFIAVLVAAISDYNQLRTFLLGASNAEMAAVVASLMAVGWGVGVVLHTIAAGVVGHKHPMPISRALYLGDSADVDAIATGRSAAASWFWSLPDGRDMAVREVTLARCIPSADARWALDDLLKVLARPESAGGSDILDRKVAQALGIKGRALKPTQSRDDAVQLLSLRYRGYRSDCEWSVRTERQPSGKFRAYVSVRARFIDAEHRCVSADGPTEALAITIAAITRETWTYTT